MNYFKHSSQVALFQLKKKFWNFILTTSNAKTVILVKQKMHLRIVRISIRLFLHLMTHEKFRFSSIRKPCVCLHICSNKIDIIKSWGLAPVYLKQLLLQQSHHQSKTIIKLNAVKWWQNYTTNCIFFSFLKTKASFRFS